MNSLHNKRILFIAPVFFDHHIAISNELNSMGAIVYSFPDIDNNLFIRALKALRLFELYRKIYFLYIWLVIYRKSIDIVFVIKGQNLNKKFFIKLRGFLNKSKFILYQWDSIINHNYLDIISQFDIAYSFDPEDCKKYKIKYLPLYFGKEYLTLRRQKAKSVGVLYIGQYIPQRHKFLYDFKAKIEERGIKVHFYEYIKFRKYLKEIIINKENTKNLKLTRLNRKQVINLYSFSDCIIDMPSPSQSGITMRCFETLGGHMKLITTNRNIFSLDINSENVMLIDSIEINQEIILKTHEFIHKKFVKDDTIDDYLITKWLEKVLDTTIFFNKISD